MINRTLLSPNELISSLNQLQSEGFIFRGHSDGKYILQPSVYRKDSLIKLAEIYPERTNQKKWCSSAAIQETIKAWTNGVRPWYLERIFKYILHLMHYNHALQDFYSTKENPKDENDHRLLGIFPEDHWIQQSTFEGLFDFVYRLHLPIDDLSGNRIKEPYYIEETTGFDESWPQHYDFYTALLDWSRNPLVAIYFSLGSLVVETKKSERMLYVTSNLPSPYLSIFAYKETVQSDSIPVKIIHGSVSKTNLRLQNQEGTFTHFTKAFEFFIHNATFPSMEGYHFGGAELVRLNIERTTTNLKFLKAFIEDKGICESFLFPDKKRPKNSSYDALLFTDHSV